MIREINGIEGNPPFTAPRLSVVVPCYNEEPGIPELHRRVVASCVEELGSNFELVLVDDRSSDRSWEIMERLAAADPRVRAIKLARNYGHQIALTAGLQLCRGERILIIDADLQDPPELLGEMMRLMDGGADVVFGQRRRREGESAFKKLSATAFYRTLRYFSEIDIPPDTGDFRLMNRRALDVLNAMPERYRFIRGMVSWLGLCQVPLLYDRAPRFAGTTKYPLRKMIRFAVDALTGFSVVPLRIASCLGLAMSAASALMIAYALAGWFSGRALTGWTSLVSITLAVASVQLLVLGVMGEYLGRIYMESKHRPLFVVEKLSESPAQRREARTSAVAAVEP